MSASQRSNEVRPCRSPSPRRPRARRRPSGLRERRRPRRPSPRSPSPRTPSPRSLSPRRRWSAQPSPKSLRARRRPRGPRHPPARSPLRVKGPSRTASLPGVGRLGAAGVVAGEAAGEPAAATTQGAFVRHRIRWARRRAARSLRFRVIQRRSTSLPRPLRAQPADAVAGVAEAEEEEAAARGLGWPTSMGSMPRPRRRPWIPSATTRSPTPQTPLRVLGAAGRGVGPPRSRAAEATTEGPRGSTARPRVAPASPGSR